MASALTHSADSQTRGQVRVCVMAQAVCIILGATDRERLAAIRAYEVFEVR